MFSEKSFELLIQSLPVLAKGALITLEIALVAVMIGFCGGLLCGILNCKKLQTKLAALIIDSFVWIVRGTPLFVQLLIIYYAVPEMIGVSFSPFTAGVIALGINSTAYISEIIRAGIDAIPVGQWEAAYVLGYNRWQTLRSVILPQMFYQVLPSLTNELTALIKETSILMVIGVAELTKASKDIVARELDPMTIYLAAAVFYLLLTSSVSLATQRIQRGLQHA
jgi:polar amino acid transport system permease protein